MISAHSRLTLLAKPACSRYKTNLDFLRPALAAMSAKFHFYFFSYLTPLADGEGG
jgi:hypothetical protein